MFGSFCGLKIEGKCFTQETNLKFFDKEYHRFCLIYGKNGSGKSTISRAFKIIKDNQISNLRALDKDNNEIFLTEDEKKQIFVFNEEYIDSKVKIKDDGLDAIVLLGDVANLDIKIKKIDHICKKLQQREENFKRYFEKYQDIENKNNPEKYKNKIEQTLKQLFVARWKKIEDRKRVMDSSIYSFNNAVNIIKSGQNINSYEDILKNFENKMKDYEKIRSDLNFTNEIKPLEPNKIKELLAYQVKQTQLTQNEERIKQAIVDDKISQNLMQSDKNICPYCFQKLTNEYKQEVLSALENILNPDIQNHQTELKNYKTNQNLIDDLMLADQIQTLDTKLYEKIISQLNKYKEIINQKIVEKIKNPFESVYLDEKFSVLLNEINQDLAKLEQKRKEFQEQKVKENELKMELTKINKELTYLEIKDDFNDYEEKLKIKENLEYRQKLNNNRLKYIKNKKIQLESQKAQTNIAQEQINQYLKYIFFKEDRLKLENVNKTYILKSNGNRVRAKDISMGERNAIALSYFFTEIFSGENQVDFYKKPKFIVIDDPISSFDFENKVGMMSFLNYQIKRILKDCKDSKIIVLTHDLMSVFELRKIGKKFNDFSHYELKNKELKDFGDRNRQYSYSEYKYLLNEIYNYADNSDADDENINIGNTMRKVLEAFGTFNYQCGIEDIVKDEIISDKLSDKQKNYFKNFMYRLVLHGDSHLENKTKALDFFQYLDDREKKTTAQSVLSLLFLLNKEHLKIYLNDDNKLEKVKNNWLLKCELN